jgi:hypothetical protein
MISFTLSFPQDGSVHVVARVAQPEQDAPPEQDEQQERYVPVARV